VENTDRSLGRHLKISSLEHTVSFRFQITARQRELVTIPDQHLLRGGPRPFGPNIREIVLGGVLPRLCHHVHLKAHDLFTN
jgi:hypothetical protein